MQYVREGTVLKGLHELINHVFSPDFHTLIIRTILIVSFSCPDQVELNE